MTPEDFKKMRLAFEYYQKALEEAIAFNNTFAQEFEKICNDEICSDQEKK